MVVSFEISRRGRRFYPPPPAADPPPATPSLYGPPPPPPPPWDAAGAGPGFGSAIAIRSGVRGPNGADPADSDLHPCFALNLFPDGYSIGGLDKGMLEFLIGDDPEKKPYTRAFRALLSDIVYGCLPQDILHGTPCKFHNGIVVCEVRDYRSFLSNGGDSSGYEFPKMNRVALRLGTECVGKHLSLIADPSWIYHHQLIAESTIINSLQPLLHLDPTPCLEKLCNSVKKLACDFVDTEEFQRLRDLEQLGLTYLVYPGAVHTRSKRSLGVYQLAGEAMKNLQMNQGKELGMDRIDVQTVKLAGLLHDFGHGPFSPLFEHEFLPRVGPGSTSKWSREQMSALQLDNIVDKHAINIEPDYLKIVKLGHGDYSASSTKVHCMVNTLAVDSEAKQTIETLQAELKKTKERLQAIEELKGQSDAGTAVDVNVAEKLAQLKNQVPPLEKREERSKAVFFERSSVFRKACCSLPGYQIVRNDEQQSNGIHVTRSTVQSVYAQNDRKAELLFSKMNPKELKAVRKYLQERSTVFGNKHFLVSMKKCLVSVHLVVAAQNSFQHIIGRPLKQTIDGTCGIVCPAKCIEVQHRMIYEAQYGVGTFSCNAASPRKIRKVCRLEAKWNPKAGAYVGAVLPIIKDMGVRTTNAPTPAPPLLSLNSWQVYKWDESDESGILSANHIAHLLDTCGPFVVTIWVSPWYHLFDRAQDNNKVYKSGCARSSYLQTSSRVMFKERVGWHAVLIFEYRWCNGDLHICAQDNHDCATGPERWIHFEELQEVQTISVELMPRFHR